MVNLRSVYRHAEEHVTLLIFGLFALLVVFILAQSIFSPFFVLSIVLAVGFFILSFYKPLWTLGFVAVYLPFETVILKFISDDIYVVARYFSEGLIYILCVVVLWKWLSGKIKLQQTPLDLPFILFLIVLLSSALIHSVDPTIAILGTRQIIRFILVFFLVVYLRPSKTYIKTMTMIMLGIVAFQSLLGLAQSFIGEPMDLFLLPSDARTFGEITLTAGVSQFWDPGSRIFATFGRYDRLGNFLFFFLLIAAGFFYEKQNWIEKKHLGLLFLVAIPALVLTYSRASWFAFLLGFFYIGIILKKDKRIFIGFIALILFLSSYLALSGLQVRFITEAPGQTVTERFYESFSYARWRGEYVGLGRVFWFVQTPLSVISASPLFGFGPGQFGGGAVAALGNTTVYEQLGLPYGVYGTEGMIDNNWFSLWGESGTLGMIFYLWMFGALFFFALRVVQESKDPLVRALAAGFTATIIAVAFNAFTSTVLEIRTLAFYFWLYAGFLYVLHQKKPRPNKERKRLKEAL